MTTFESNQDNNQPDSSGERAIELRVQVERDIYKSRYPCEFVSLEAPKAEADLLAESDYRRRLAEAEDPSGVERRDPQAILDERFNRKELNQVRRFRSHYGFPDEKVFGNPPFIGQYTKTPAQTADMKHVWGADYDGYLDYVTGWHAQSMRLFRRRPGEFAYVTTNSITQGQPVPSLFGPLEREGWHIKFAHRTFAWDSEAPGKAAVHCVIVGFTRNPKVALRLWEYPDVHGEPVEQRVDHAINAYLVDGPQVLVRKASKPLSPVVGPVTYGSKPADGGHLIVEPEDYEDVAADPIAAKYLRPFKGAKELIHNTPRWCLWMAGDDFDPADLSRSRVLKERVRGVRQFREAQTHTGDAYKLKDTPHLFRPNLRRPEGPYLCIPRHVSENRRYFLAQRFPAEVICGDANFQAAHPDGLLFGLISSTMFITWLETISGRLTSRLRFSNTLVWNTFPVPDLDEKTRQKIIEAGKGVLAARGAHPDWSLAQHYNLLAMNPGLIRAHDKLDKVVDKAFGAPKKLSTPRQRLELLFAHYAALTGQAG